VLAIGALVVGCAREATRSREAAPPDLVASAPVDDDTSEDDDAASSLRAGVSSPPRDAWPCALAADDGSRSVFGYGERTSCRIPRSLGAFGVHGCPDRIEHTPAEGAYETRTFEYDDEGRLIVFHADVTLRYAWEGDRLVSVAREHGAFDVSSYRDDGAPTGFFDAGPPRAVGGGGESPAPEATGAGILFDTGDVAEVIYWDGVRWRLLMLDY
jgi:hypothetical protein